MALFVGAKHSGKTCAAVSFMSPAPSTKRVKVLDGDGRIRGILGAPWVDKSRIDYDFYPPRVAGNNKPFFERVNQDLAALLVEIQSGKCLYETYVADSLTSFCKNLILDAIPLTHAEGKGRSIGSMAVTGVEEFKFEATGADGYLSYLRSLPFNVIATAHLVDKWDKPPAVDAKGRETGGKDLYAESIIVGEQLSIRPKIGQNSSIYFDHIFKFVRKMVNGSEKFYVEFIGDFACTSFTGLTPGLHDITGINFRDYLMSKVKGV
jgi:hypothetical protein